MKLCYKTTLDTAGRIYLPKEILVSTNAKRNDTLYVVADEKSGSIVIANEKYFERNENKCHCKMPDNIIGEVSDSFAMFDDDDRVFVKDVRRVLTRLMKEYKEE